MRKYNVVITVGLFISFGAFIGFLLYWWSYQQTFNKIKWAEGDEGFGYPNRKYMFNDLIKNHQIKGLDYKKLVENIGKPRIDSGSNKFYYNIELDYGYDIDPVYIKNLVIALNNDSIVTSFKIEEWKH